MNLLVEKQLFEYCHRISIDHDTNFAIFVFCYWQCFRNLKKIGRIDPHPTLKDIMECCKFFSKRQIWDFVNKANELDYFNFN